MRNFNDLSIDSKIRETYTKMYTQQNLNSVKKLKSKYKPGQHGHFSIEDILNRISSVIDESDPDTNHGQDIHAYQTAERIKNSISHLIINLLIRKFAMFLLTIMIFHLY